MKHIVVVYEIEDDAVQEFPAIPGANVKYIGMTPGIKLRQVGTGEEAFIPYARWFDGTSSNNFHNDLKYQEYNWLFLRTQQNWANDMLSARGHLLLNDVHDLLGLSRTTMGAVVGWVYEAHKKQDPSQPNFVDFGCWAQETDPLGNGKPGAILLDFNVQGPILHALK